MNTQRMPGIGAVIRAQLELLVRTKYVVGLFGYMTLMVLTTYLWLPRFESMPPWEGPWFMILYGGLVGTAAIAGATVWFNEGPRNRRYHWAMPVKRELHDLTRVVVGAVLLIAMIAVSCVLAWLLEDPITREQWLRGAPLFWASLFLVPLLAYLLLTIPCLLFARPLLAILAVIITGVILSLEPVAEKYPTLGDLGDALFSYKHPPSLGAAVAGGLTTAPWAEPAERQRVYSAVAEAFWKEADVSTNQKNMWVAEMQSTMLKPPVITKREWLWTLTLWYVMAFLGIAFAIRRRPDV